MLLIESSRIVRSRDRVAAHGPCGIACDCKLDLGGLLRGPAEFPDPMQVWGAAWPAPASPDRNLEVPGR